MDAKAVLENLRAKAMAKWGIFPENTSIVEYRDGFCRIYVFPKVREDGDWLALTFWNEWSVEQAGDECLKRLETELVRRALRRDFQ